ncbi:MAG: hypothetical protein RLZZ156_1074 [Deinococcota bacterium]|jgi:hypothetical protein
MLAKKWFFCLLFLSSSALAHWSDLSAAEVLINDNQASLTLTFPTRLAEVFDTDQSGVLSSAEIKTQKSGLHKFFNQKIKVLSGGQQADFRMQAASIAKNLGPKENTHSTIILTYQLEAGIKDFWIVYELFLEGVSTASCVATIFYNNQVQEIIFRPDAKEFRYDSQTANIDFFGFVKLGIEHILTGYDHLLFVLSLLMLGGGLAYLLKVITAFTLAHSISLSLAALNIVHLPAKLVESGIALTIAFVAAENLWRKDVTALTRSRWIFTFVFGLIHGLGFAGVLKEIGLPQNNVAVSLLGFNAGVEIGQLAVVIPAFLVLQALKRIPWELRLRQTVSVFAVAAGLFWFVERAFS